MSWPSEQDLEFVAINIVNQILDEAGTDVATRQAINDDCHQFVVGMLESLVCGEELGEQNDIDGNELGGFAIPEEFQPFLEKLREKGCIEASWTLEEKIRICAAIRALGT